MDLIKKKIKIFFFELLIIFFQSKLFIQFFFENQEIKFKNQIDEKKMNIIVS